MKTPQPLQFTLALLLAALGLALIVTFLRPAMPPPSDDLAPVAAENEPSLPSGDLSRPAAPPIAEATVVAADPATPPAMWRVAKESTGVKLQPLSAAAKKTRAQGGKLEGRSAPFDAGSMVSLASLQRGDVITLPLIGGELVKGEVNLVQAGGMRRRRSRSLRSTMAWWKVRMPRRSPMRRRVRMPTTKASRSPASR